MVGLNGRGRNGRRDAEIILHLRGNVLSCALLFIVPKTRAVRKVYCEVFRSCARHTYITVPTNPQASSTFSFCKIYHSVLNHPFISLKCRREMKPRLQGSLYCFTCASQLHHLFEKSLAFFYLRFFISYLSPSPFPFTSSKVIKKRKERDNSSQKTVSFNKEYFDSTHMRFTPSTTSSKPLHLLLQLLSTLSPSFHFDTIERSQEVNKKRNTHD